MSKSDPSSTKKERNKTVRWVIIIFLVTIFISAVISFASTELMSDSSMTVAFIILLVIILLGILFDVIGVAVTSADEKPFHSMAAHKVNGAQEAIKLLRNTEKVSTICNDVIGDVCGVVSGSASAAIAAQVFAKADFTSADMVTLLMSALVAGLTVGGKAIGKVFAVHSCTKIVEKTGKVIWIFGNVFRVFKKKK